MDNLKATLPNDRLCWFVNLQNSEAGAWLRDIPRFDNALACDEFRTALRYRLYLPAYNVRVGSMCSCSARGQVDATGMHFATGCALYNLRKDTHDGVVLAADQMLKWLGFWTKREEKGIFQINNPDDNCVPDISINNPIECGYPKLLLDVSIVGPLVGAEKGQVKIPSNNEAVTPFRLGYVRFHGKKNKYEQRANQAGCGFLPIIFMSTGAMHPESKKFFAQVTKHAAAAKKIPSNVLYNFVIRNLSLALQKGISRAINHRINRMSVHSMPAPMRATALDHIT
jgi:hypothetical protein